MPHPDATQPRNSTSLLLRGWDAAFYVLTTLALLSMVVAEGNELRWTLGSIGAVLALMAAYPLLGRRGLLIGDQRRVSAYLVLLVLVVSLASGASSMGTLLLFVGYSQIWLLTETMRAGIAWNAVLTVAAGLALLTGQPDLVGSPGTLFGQLGVGLLFSMAMGWWLTSIGRSREQREDLLHRLRAAEDELAAGHHAAGVLAERARVAQEIHDTLAQGFTSVVMLAQTAQAQVARDQLDPAAERLAQIESVARENLEEARSLVAAFGPSGLMDDDLPAALHRVAERLTQETGLAVSVEIDGPAPEDRELQVVLLRTAQEALNNVRRHAHADSARVRLSVRERIELEVVDDGRGLPPDSADGVGLRGMRRRITAAGGTVQIENADPGVRVRAHLPTREQS